MTDPIGFSGLIGRADWDDGAGIYREGNLLISPPGSRHAIASEMGCVVLAVWERPVRIVAD